MSMSENSGDKEMGDSKNNLPDAGKTNDAPSTVGNEIPTTPQPALPSEKSMLEPPSFTSFRDQYIEAAGKYIGQESPFFVSEELRSGKTPQISTSYTSPSFRQASEEIYDQLSPFPTREMPQTRFQNINRIDESSVIGVLPSSISQQGYQHVFREGDCNSQPLQDPSTPRLLNSNQPRFEHYIYSPKTSRDYPSLFSNTGEEMIGMMYLADGGMITDFDSMRLESHNRVLFHPPKLESSPEPPTTPQPKADKNEKTPIITELSTSVDGKSSDKPCCVLYRFRPEDQTTNQSEECSSLSAGLSGLHFSSRGENHISTNSETQTKQTLTNGKKSSFAESESEHVIRDKGGNGMHKRQERIQVTHFRFSDDFSQIPDQTGSNGHNIMNNDIDDDESYSNVENDLQDEHDGNSLASGHSNSKRIGKNNVVKLFKEKQKPLQRGRRRRKGEDDDYDDEHEHEHEYDRPQSIRFNATRGRNLNYINHRHHYHTKSDGDNDNDNDNDNGRMMIRGVGGNSRKRSIPAKFLPFQSSSSSSSTMNGNSGGNGDQWTERNDDNVNEGELKTSSSAFKNRGIKRTNQSRSGDGNSYEGNEMSDYHQHHDHSEDETGSRMGMERRTDVISTSTSTHPCNCKKSRCLKLYCECFSADVYCNGCNCINCQNNPEHHREREEARQQLLSRNSNAFKPKVVSDLQANRFNMRGCNCRKTGCLKKYCDCFQAGIPCGVNCRCQDCRNTVERSQAASRRVGKN